ncbi:GNAT family N-acetyltransferase [Proteobacteria bacterium 005FR1]|nr:GNAT family N-acetyltransferase [Proteobacteria bacterium 005FR1]
MIRVDEFTPGIEPDLREVFHSAIHHGCIRDYTAEQTAAWAPEHYDREWWTLLLRRLRPFVARDGGKIVGYGDLQEDGYIDHFYIHGEHQGKGVGNVLMGRILGAGAARERLYSHVSRTARPFFESHGFSVVKCQDVQVRGVWMQNYLMERRNKAG